MGDFCFVPPSPEAYDSWWLILTTNLILFDAASTVNNGSIIITVESRRGPYFSLLPPRLADYLALPIKRAASYFRSLLWLRSKPVPGPPEGFSNAQFLPFEAAFFGRGNVPLVTLMFCNIQLKFGLFLCTFQCRGRLEMQSSATSSPLLFH